MAYSIDVTIEYYRTLYDKHFRNTKHSSLIVEKKINEMPLNALLNL